MVHALFRDRERFLIILCLPFLMKLLWNLKSTMCGSVKLFYMKRNINFSRSCWCRTVECEICYGQSSGSMPAPLRQSVRMPNSLVYPGRWGLEPYTINCEELQAAGEQAQRRYVPNIAACPAVAAISKGTWDDVTYFEVYGNKNRTTVGERHIFYT